MKKILISSLIIAMCIFSAVGCQSTDKSPETESVTDNISTESETPQKRPEFTADCVVKKGNRYVIALPTSSDVIPVRNAYVKYLSRVSDELVKTAEDKIAESVKALGEEPEWALVAEDNNLFLTVEVIKFIDGAEGEGCGIDHEHIIFTEKITVAE